ncbi:autotransporter-associated beta strand repeat-containing protein [Luteolibacter arcticus]|uniref:Autotransporter-associated beta strand repeat-containing protein n=1 Tax=Luteolibacter arcticus TaxID=1581411 RepID=A0ABT3GLV6_9BACT|nr:autotransporter-associated beta strand repeat-containing protein [Luteolibacter arcticus]MCW1924455.1 autotransporter-associated beta strand repeat-containing protein [Luteolibacter arcticus]
MKFRSSNRFIALLPLLAQAPAAWAASINFATPVTVAGDADVSTTGTFLYAYNWANSTRTVNGVTFTGISSNTTVGTNLTLTQWGNVNTGAFNSGSNPFNSLSSSYKGMLVGSAFNNSVSGNVGTNTVTLNNLIAGHQYAVQFWVGDARGSTRSETLSSVGGNSVSLAFTTPTSAGGAGQYTIGTFTADAATQAFTVTATGGSIPQMNALQVRDLGIPGVTQAAAFSPDAGTYVAYGATLPVTLTSESGATIYYTMDGNDPTTSSSSGASPLIVNVAVPSTVTLKAMTAIGGKANSAVVTKAFTTVQGTGTWTNVAGGSWATATNWFGNFIPNGTDLAADFGTLGLSADAAVTLDGSKTLRNLTFDDLNSTKHAWIITGNPGLGEVLTLASSGAQPTINAKVDATLDGTSLTTTAGISKTGSGTLTLKGTNTYTGTTNISAGTFKSDGTNSMATLAASGGSFHVAGGTVASGTFTADLGGSVSVAGGAWNANCTTNPAIGSQDVTGSATSYSQTGGDVNLTGAANFLYTSNFGNQTGNLSFTGGTFTAAGIQLGMRSNSTATISDSAVVTLNSYFRFGHSTNIATPASRVLNLGDGSTFSGGTSINDGGTSGVLATASVARPSGAGDATLRINGGTLRATASSTTFMQGLTSASLLEAGGIIDTQDNGITIAQPLLHGGAAGTDGGLVKKGSGNLTLTGSSTFTGPTRITEGTLTLGTGGSISASPTITVASEGTLDAATGFTLASGQTLQGDGVLLGTLTVGANATLSPGIGGIGTLESFGNLILAGTSNFEIHKSGSTLTQDTLSGFQSITYGGTLKVTATGAALAVNDTFQLFIPSGSFGGSFASFDLPSLPAGRFWDTTQLSVDGTIRVSTVSFAATPYFSLLPGGYIGEQPVTITSESGATIRLAINGVNQAPAASPVTVTIPADATTTLTAYATKAGKTDSPVVEAIYRTVTTPTWTYENSGSWTEPLNWLSEVVATGSGVPADFSTLALSGNMTVNLDGSRTIGSLVFGDTTDSSGWTLASGSGGPLTLDNGANAPVITVNNQSTTIEATVAGSNGLTKAGAGTLRLSRANTYTGGTTVNGGTLEFATPGFLTYSGGQIDINNGSTVKIFEIGAPYRYDFGAVTYNFGATGGGTVNITGGSTNWVAQGDWTFKTNGGNKNAVSGGASNGMNMNGRSVVLDVTRGADPVSDLDVTIAVSNTVGGLTKTGAGIATLGAVNNYTGATAVNQGTLLVTGSLASGSVVIVASGATVGGSGSIGGSTTIDSGAVVAPGTAGAGTLTVGSATLAGTYLCQLDTTEGDKVIVTGALTVSPGAAITVSTLGTPTAASYVIATYGSLAGTLPAVTGIPSGYALNTATPGEIRIVKTGGFATWADSFDGLTDKTPQGDPDKDGISNLLEYVIGGDPRVSSTSFLPTYATVGSNLVLSYKRSDDSETDTTQIGQWSTNLNNWADITPVLVNENGGAPDDMTISIPVSNAANGKLFGRLHVTQP